LEDLNPAASVRARFIGADLIGGGGNPACGDEPSGVRGGKHDGGGGTPEGGRGGGKPEGGRGGGTPEGGCGPVVILDS